MHLQLQASCQSRRPPRAPRPSRQVRTPTRPRTLTHHPRPAAPPATHLRVRPLAPTPRRRAQPSRSRPARPHPGERLLAAAGTRRSEPPRAAPPRASRAPEGAPARRTGTPGAGPPPNRGARPSAHSLCDPPHAAPPAAKLLALARADRLQRIVLGLQAHMVVLAEEPLDRRLLTDQGHDDLAVGRRVLLADDHHVVREDARLDHRVPAHTQEILALLPTGDLRDLHVLLDVLLGQ